MRKYSLLLLVIPVLISADTPKKEAGKSASKLWAAISVNHPILDHGLRGDPFMIHFGLLNDSNKTIKPDLDSSQLLINGKNLKDWDFIIFNGPRDDRWDTLPPGDYLLFGIALGTHFEKPGVYKVIWKGKGFQSPEIVFRVVPKSGP
jgi:hypothetical protein